MVDDDKLLTDEELDALVEAAASSNPTSRASDGQFRPYDFRPRVQAGLAEYSAMGKLHERHADLLGVELHAGLKLEFSVRHKAPRLLNFGELVASLPARVATISYDMQPLPGGGFVICNSEMLNVIVNQFFGGGSSAPPVRSDEKLSPSELHMGEQLADKVLSTLVTVWADQIPLRPRRTAAVTGVYPLSTQISNDIALLLPFDLEVGETISELLCVLFFADLEPWRLAFARVARRGMDEATQAAWADSLRDLLPDIPLEVVSVLSRREASLAEVLKLAVGSVVELPKLDAVRVLVESDLFATGDFGAHEGKKAIRLQALGRAARETSSRG
jgi:flagellar motor switch protein FliM